ncbi:DUF6510 family protein [Nocardia sp. NBC_00416]|uniref:DUF6510 family protein n=1 Tax=Nocardia sp. NBC_00416 TaxID=2975991 RepID=UPI002E23CF7A
MTTSRSRAFGDDHVDGNALAGPLSEVFVADITLCDCRCGHCGRTGPLASAMVYTHCPGRVARCSQCARVLLRITETPTGTWLDLGSGASLRLPAPPA